MRNLGHFVTTLQQLYTRSRRELACLGESIRFMLACLLRFLFKIYSFWIQLAYFALLSFLGFLVLKTMKPRSHSVQPKSLDLFFTSVSATTVSSMSTVEMEVFSNSQLITLTILMFIGGEVFTSMVGLQLKKLRLEKTQDKIASAPSDLSSNSSPPNIIDQIEMGMVKNPVPESLGSLRHFHKHLECMGNEAYLKYTSIKWLGFTVLGYLLAIHVLGVIMVLLYLAFNSSARDVLKTKGLKMVTFSIFTIVSTFASCGFVPTNENMVVFRKNPGFLLILIPQILLGNTLFPSCLRFSIWVLGKIVKKMEMKYLLENSREIGYLHLLPRQHSRMLVGSVIGFVLIQVVMFCSMEWDSLVLSGMNWYEKISGVLFQTVNSRHTGETIVDLSAISPAILVLFAVMMYLPPYTSFLPIKDDNENKERHLDARKRRKWGRSKTVENLILSQLSYLVIFIIIVCITERKKMKEDPLNFNVFNIAFEVISAYGNVGFSVGYSCERQLKPQSNCVDKWYGFSGRWSDEGKCVLILVMLFGRLKKFNMDGGKAWKLL